MDKSKIKKTSLFFGKAKSFIKGIFLGIIIGIILMSLITHFTKASIFGPIVDGKDSFDHFLQENFFGYTLAEYQDAILGASKDHKELIVMEQNLEVNTTITKAGLAELPIFNKVKNITYSGIGIYTINLNNLNREDIIVDKENKTITINIPCATLQYVQPKLENTTFEDTEKGLLAFGDIKLTSEQFNEIENTVVSKMKEKLEDKKLIDKANNYAIKKVKEIYEPIIKNMSSDYKLNINIK